MRKDIFACKKTKKTETLLLQARLYLHLPWLFPQNAHIFPNSRTQQQTKQADS